MPTPTPTQPPDDAHKTAVQVMTIILATCAMLNVLFYFLSGYYYDDRRATQGMMSEITDATVRSTRLSFGLFSGLTSVSLVASLFAPKIVGHVLAAAIGLASLVAAIAAATKGVPGALTITLIVIGLLYPALVVLSLIQRSRGAWSFLCAMAWVLGVIMLFGAPKIRSQINIGLWTAMIIPGLLFVSGVALTMIRTEYRDRSY
jgi:hypothetical protein